MSPLDEGYLQIFQGLLSETRNGSLVSYFKIHVLKEIILVGEVGNFYISVTKHLFLAHITGL
jgi:hypothetical protein